MPKLSVEYFNKQFLLHKIGQKIGRVIKIDSTTENMERGQYTRLCVEVDLTKPLLSKFRLNGRIWGIQYEGLKMICFKCGRQGHKEEVCPTNTPADLTDAVQARPVDSIAGNHGASQEKAYGSWMLVKKPPRRINNRQPSTSRNRGGQDLGDPNIPRSHTGLTLMERDKESAQIPDLNPLHTDLAAPHNQGSRFRALAAFDLNMETEIIGDVAEQETDSNPKQLEDSHVAQNQSMSAERHQTGQHGPQARGENENRVMQTAPRAARLTEVDRQDAAQMGTSPAEEHTSTLHVGPVWPSPGVSNVATDVLAPREHLQSCGAGPSRGQRPRTGLGGFHDDPPDGVASRRVGPHGNLGSALQQPGPSAQSHDSGRDLAFPLGLRRREC